MVTGPSPGWACSPGASCSLRSASWALFWFRRACAATTFLARSIASSRATCCSMLSVVRARQLLMSATCWSVSALRASILKSMVLASAFRELRLAVRC